MVSHGPFHVFLAGTTAKATELFVQLQLSQECLSFDSFLLPKPCLRTLGSADHGQVSEQNLLPQGRRMGTLVLILAVTPR